MSLRYTGQSKGGAHWQTSAKNWMPAFTGSITARTSSSSCTSTLCGVAATPQCSQATPPSYAAATAASRASAAASVLLPLPGGPVSAPTAPSPWTKLCVKMLALALCRRERASARDVGFQSPLSFSSFKTRRFRSPLSL